ncbi:hypothetical protein CACET_c36990 [Clostridium aceticum]|uniref:Uncharacterized protein n=1 Tax=Clostridium aceticum TaxID=84022 RepID=A0A0G3WGV9_9CLOT|nr:hypothetical protein CACET_c36990 [Clostridium aceticum]
MTVRQNFRNNCVKLTLMIKKYQTYKERTREKISVYTGRSEQVNREWWK